jgi:hypothetical protein
MPLVKPLRFLNVFKDYLKGRDMTRSKPYSTLLGPCLMACLFSVLTPSLQAQTISNTETGTQGGYYYYFWKGTIGSVSMTLMPNGRYTTTWNQVDNFIAGKGWEIGSPDRVVDFTGSFEGGVNGTLALYGWTRNPLVEYYVVENHGTWTPPGGVQKGTLVCDGGTYQIYENSKLTNPAINGFTTYWSVRTTKRSSGTVTFAKHVAAWKAVGMDLGAVWDYQIMATEGYQSNGNSDITIGEKLVTDLAETAVGESQGVKVYPNPVRDRVTVFLPEQQAELSLYTDKGIRVVHLQAERKEVEIEMAEFGPGIYLLKVESGGQTFTKKMIVL